MAALPGIVGHSIGLPDIHSGYGFAIGEYSSSSSITFLDLKCDSSRLQSIELDCFAGNMAAFDMNDPLAVVSPGGVGFDINCGVRLLRTNLTEKDVQPVKASIQLI